MNDERTPCVPRALAAPRVLGAPLLHPLALAALLMLVVNDHWLKHAFPGVVTGKLSDCAGMLLFPLFLFALGELLLAPAGVRLERPRLRRSLALACGAVTALVFAAIKTWEPATAAFRSWLGALQCAPHALDPTSAVQRCHAHCVRDPSDLVALPLVLVAARLVEPAQLKSRPSSTPKSNPSTQSLKY